MIIDSNRFGSGDPFAPQVTILMHGNGANGGTTITNEVAGGVALVGSSGANVFTSTTQSVYNGSSLRIQSGGFVLFNPDSAHAALNFGTGDFTIEFLFRPDSTAAAQMPFQIIPASGTVDMQIYTNTTDIIYYSDPSDRINSGAGALTALTWGPWALSRVSGTSRMFSYGIQVGSSFADTRNYINVNRLRLGNYISGGYAATGYYAELRVTKAGRYAGNYTPAAGPFPNP